MWNNFSQYQLQGIALDLYNNKIVQFGQFTLRSGQTSEIYFDLRRLISHPTLLSRVVHQYMNIFPFDPKNHLICGVPTAAVPSATIYSHYTNCQMIMLRKERKEYGTKKMIEGDFNSGDNVILLDDVITTGGSLIESINELELAGLNVIQIIVLIDRRSNKERLDHLSIDNGKKYPINVVFTMDKLLNMLVQQNINVPTNLLNINNSSWNNREKLITNPVTKKLINIIQTKQTNLVFSIDVTTTDEFLHLTNLIGPEICLLKTHIDLLQDFNYERVIIPLLKLAEKHNFMILEDRKFADIGNTVSQQYNMGIYRISDWADLVTCHTIMGEGIIEAFITQINNLNTTSPQTHPEVSPQAHQEVSPRAILLIAQLSNKGNLITSEYTKQTCDLALKYPNIVAGVICQNKLLNDSYLHLTPGVNLATKSDQFDQQYNTPDYVISHVKSDLIIVGRGIYNSTDPLETARQFRQQGWNAYLHKIKS